MSVDFPVAEASRFHSSANLTTVRPMMATGRARQKWRHLIVLGVLAFSLSPILLYGQLQAYRDALPRTGPNDGMAADFFVFHGTPNFAHPEDFSLYVIRAKRIADRGWVDHLFGGYGLPNLPKNVFQYLIGRIMLLTEGSPPAYAAVWFGLLLVSHLMLYTALSRAFGHTLGLGGRLAIVTVFATCPSLGAALSLVGDLANATDPSVWPGGRLSRLSTFAWSNGLLASVVVLAARRMADRAGDDVSAVMLAVTLVPLALGDVWAFAIAACVVSFAVSFRWLRALRESSTPGALHASVRWLAEQRIILLGLAISGAAYAALHAAGHPDATDRAGLGAAWIGRGGFSFAIFDRWSWGFLGRAGLVVAPMLACFHFLHSWRNPAPYLIVLLSGLAMAALAVLSAWFGVHGYQMTQFHIRVESCLWLALLIVVARATRRAGAPPRRRIRNPAHARAIAVALCAAVPLAYTGLSAVRTNAYIGAVGARYTALPKRIEHLRAVVTCLDARRGIEDAATLSPEINHLLAYWTDADLHLPVGFPLHEAGPNERIVTRAAAVLNLFNVGIESWIDFPSTDQVDSTLFWRRSRLLSARQGYMYWMFHRVGLRDHRLLVVRISALLGPAPAGAGATPAPRIILEDEVSRALGRPDTGGYDAVWREGPITLWLRTNDLEPAIRGQLLDCGKAGGG